MLLAGADVQPTCKQVVCAMGRSPLSRRAGGVSKHAGHVKVLVTGTYMLPPSGSPVPAPISLRAPHKSEVAGSLWELSVHEMQTGLETSHGAWRSG